MSNGSRRWQPPHADPAKTLTQAPRGNSAPKPSHLCAWGECTDAYEVGIGVPLCLHHVQRASVAYGDYVERVERERLADAEAKIDAGLLLTSGEHVPGWVYYIEIDGLIKIGYTTNITNRTRAYPPTAKLLAIEPGTKALERGRHSIFNQHLARGREWFNDHPDIRTWIDTLRKQYGDPSDEAYKFSTPTEKKPIVGSRRMNRRW